MNELQALAWAEQQNGLKIRIGKNRKITLTDGQTFEVAGTGLLDAVVKLIKVLECIEKTSDQVNRFG